MTQSKKIHIAYGSESGNAHTLADELKQKLKEFTPTLSMLDELSLPDMTNWTDNDILLVISSTTGNGEAPSNANDFYQSLIQKRMQQRMKSDTSTVDCLYAVFGLGDVNYENFCGFSIVVDGMLDKLGATAIAKRVDADVDYEDFFELWSDALLDYFSINDSMEDSVKEETEQVLKALELQVLPD